MAPAELSMAPPRRISFHIISVVGFFVVLLSAGGFAYCYKTPSDDDDQFASTRFHVGLTVVFGSYLIALLFVSTINWSVSVRVVGKVQADEPSITDGYVVTYQEDAGTTNAATEESIHTLQWNRNIPIREWDHGDSIQCTPGEKVMDLLVVPSYPASARPCRRIGCLWCPYFSYSFCGQCGCDPILWIVFFVLVVISVNTPPPFVYYSPTVFIPMAVLHAFAIIGSFLMVWPSQLYNYAPPNGDGCRQRDLTTIWPTTGDDYVSMTHNNPTSNVI